MEGIAEVGGILYTAGYEQNSRKVNVATVWKIDGGTVTPMVLTEDATWDDHAGVQSIVEIEGSIYAAGSDDRAVGTAATVWKIDGSTVTAIPLTDGTRYEEVYDIAESEGVLYAAGEDKTGATVWKITDGEVTAIPLSEGKEYGSTYAVIARME